MKVAKKVRLLTKDNKGKLYVKSDNFVVLRDRAVVLEETILEHENSYPENGILYVVDEKATKEWEDTKKAKHALKVEVKKQSKKQVEDSTEN